MISLKDFGAILRLARCFLMLWMEETWLVSLFSSFGSLFQPIPHVPTVPIWTRFELLWVFLLFLFPLSLFKIWSLLCLIPCIRRFQLWWEISKEPTIGKMMRENIFDLFLYFRSFRKMSKSLQILLLSLRLASQRFSTSTIVPKSNKWFLLRLLKENKFNFLLPRRNQLRLLRNILIRSLWLKFAKSILLISQLLNPSRCVLTVSVLSSFFRMGNIPRRKQKKERNTPSSRLLFVLFVLKLSQPCGITSSIVSARCIDANKWV